MQKWEDICCFILRDTFFKELPISNKVYKMIPYIVTMIVLTFSSKNSQTPRAEGISYDKRRR